MGRISNISPESFRGFITSQGLKCIRITGGHEVWSKSGMKRPVIFQTHINPIPEFIIKNNLRNLNKTRKDLEDFLTNNNDETLSDRLC